MKNIVNLAMKVAAPLLAATFVFSAGAASAGPVLGADAPNAQTPNCLACSTSGVQLAQREPIPRGTPVQVGAAIDPRTILDVGNGGLTTCCDPKLAGIKIASMFGEDQISGQPFGAAYGVVWNPSGNIPFLQGMENSAFMANVMAGQPYSHFIIEAELRTKNVKGQPLPATAAAVTSEWSGGTTMTPGWPAIVGVWDSPWLPVSDPNFMSNWSYTNPFSRTAVATSGPAHPTGTTAPHMRADGTLYTVKFSYAMAYFVNGVWTKRRVYCNNLKEQYWAFQKGSSVARVGGGQGSGLQSINFDAAPVSENERMTLGAPVAMRPEEIARLPNGGRIPQRN